MRTSRVTFTFDVNVNYDSNTQQAHTKDSKMLNNKEDIKQALCFHIEPDQVKNISIDKISWSSNSEILL